MIHCICAYFLEAQPLIEHFKLKPQTSIPFPIFSNEFLRIIISGRGKISSASATAYLGALYPEVRCWLNLGIAGHASYSLGTLILASSIQDEETKKTHYNRLLFSFSGKREPIITKTQPDTSYIDPGVYDMEASGFAEAALKFTSLELIQSVKIISDNASNPSYIPNKQQIQKLYTPNMPILEEILKQFHKVGSSLPEINFQSSMLNPFKTKYRFSETETHRLTALLKTFLYHKMSLEMPYSLLAHSKNKKECLESLENFVKDSL